VGPINLYPTTAYQVQLQVDGLSGPAGLERLQAPSAASTTGVTLGGRSFGRETTTGELPETPRTERVLPTLGGYTVTLPPASAALLTPTIGSGGGGVTG
jgi:hypothetical protein